MNKEELLRCVKSKVGNLNIKFPTGIDFQENNHVITIAMQGGIAKNMQEDSAAFEGWILCIKAAMDTEAEKYKFILDWDEVAVDNLHYQRFLYRVDKFIKLFGSKEGWFAVKTTQKLDALKIKYNSNEKYVMNVPASGERINNSDDSEENYLENEIVRRQEELKGLKKICPVCLNRQLPVGVFKKDVSEDSAIFPHRKSAIDLWGVDSKDLYIFELKAKDNYKVGAISEIFFYVMVLQDEQLGRFVRASAEGELIRNTNQIKAFILAPELHPLITIRAFDLLNKPLKKYNIEFGYVRMEYKLAFNFNREF